MESRDSSSWFWIGLAVVLLLEVFAVLATTTAPSGGYYSMMGGVTWGWAIVMMMVPALVLLLILMIMFGVLRGPTPVAYHPTYLVPAQRTLETLEQRYASGEQSRDDYLRIRGDLTHDSSQP